MNRRELFSLFGITAVVGVTEAADIKTVTPDLIPDIKSDNKFIDLSSVSNRMTRYAQYERFLVQHPSVYDKLVERSVQIADRLYDKFDLKNHWLDNVPNQSKRFDAFHLRLIVQSAATYGDWFGELVVDPADKYPRPLTYVHLGADTVYRIETIKGKLLEFQQSKTGPDYASLARASIDKATDADLCKATAIRFHPEQICHIRPNLKKVKGHYPYGVSALHGNEWTNQLDMGFAFENDITEGVRELISRFE
jgi:hypothetical protein